MAEPARELQSVGERAYFTPEEEQALAQHAADCAWLEERRDELYAKYPKHSIAVYKGKWSPSACADAGNPRNHPAHCVLGANRGDRRLRTARLCAADGLQHMVEIDYVNTQLLSACASSACRRAQRRLPSNRSATRQDCKEH